MRIAIICFRGIPAKYGGVETFIENLVPLLVQKRPVLKTALK